MPEFFASFGNDGSASVAPTLWTPITIPANQVAATIGDASSALLNSSAPAIVSYRDDDIVEFISLIAIPPGEHLVVVEPGSGSAPPFAPIPELSGVAFQAQILDQIVVAHEESDLPGRTRLPLRTTRVEKFAGGRFRLWAEITRGPGSDWARFSGKLEVSDQTDPNVVIEELASVRISVLDSELALFEQSGRSSIEFDLRGDRISDGQAFPFSGLVYVGSEEPEVVIVPDAVPYGVGLSADLRAVWDQNLPGGGRVPNYRPVAPMVPRIRAESMALHPLAQFPWSNTTGGRQCMGSPGNYAARYVETIFDLRDAADTEAFRGIHRLETTGEPVKTEDHPGIIHDDSWPSPYGTDSLGKLNPDGSRNFWHGISTGTGGWRPQDTSHLCYHLPIVFASLTLDAATLDSVRRQAEVMLRARDRWRYSRHPGRLIKALAEIAETPLLGADLRQAVVEKLELTTAAAEFWLLTPGDSNDSNATGVRRDGLAGPVRPWGVGRSYAPVPSWSVFMNGLASNAAPHLDKLGLLPQSLRVLFHDIVRTTIAEGIFWRDLDPHGRPDGWGIWYWLEFDTVNQDPQPGHWLEIEADGHGVAASSTRLQILTCAPGIVWILREGVLPDEDHAKACAILLQVATDDRDAARWLWPWITREELDALVACPPSASDCDPAEPQPPNPIYGKEVDVVLIYGGTHAKNDRPVPVYVATVFADDGSVRPIQPFILESKVEVDLDELG